MHISFLCLHLLETQKRRVLFLTFTDWEAFAALLLEAWTSPASGLELDPQLTATLRHLKGHMADARLSAIMLGAVQAAQHRAAPSLPLSEQHRVAPQLPSTTTAASQAH